MRRLGLTLITLIFLIYSGWQTTHAAALTPLYATMHGSLVSWTAEQGVVLLSKWNYNDTPMASSDGIHIVLSSEDESQIKDFIAKNGPESLDGQWPDFWRNIVLFDIRDNSMITIAGQPQNGKYGTLSQVSYVIRSKPSWSPDGKALAWMEFPYSEVTRKGGAELVIYRLASASSKRYPVNVQGADLGGPSMETRWGKTGIAVRSVFNEGVGDLFTFNPDGKQLYYHSLGFEQTEGESEINNDPLWIDYGKREYLGSSLYPYLLDVVTDKGKDYTGTLELYNPLAPNGLRVSIPLSAKESTGEWQIVDATGKLVYKPESPHITMSFTRAFALAPDGQHVAFIDSTVDTQRVMIYYNGHVTQAFDDTAVSAVKDLSYNMIGLTWGPTRWQIR